MKENTLKHPKRIKEYVAGEIYRTQNENIDFDDLLEKYIEKEKELSEKEWEANMKQRVQWLIDDNDDYIHFIEQFKQL